MLDSTEAGTEFTVRPLSPETWDAFARLAEWHNGVWGGCWCTWFHPAYAEKTHTADGNRALSASFLYNGTRSLFEQAGFSYDRPKGKSHCVMSTKVAPMPRS